MLSYAGDGIMDASVVMAAAATKQDYFAASIDSILKQSFSDFELIIIDDGLSEENRAYLNGLSDSRLHIIRNDKNIGQSRSVNKGLRQATGKYIVRMDADDIMRPNRIAEQVRYMESHPNVVAAGAFAKRTDNGVIIPTKYSSQLELRLGLLFSCDMIHPTMIINRALMEKNKIKYNEDILYAQDYMFWADASNAADIAQINSIVLDYRIHPGQISSKKKNDQIRYANQAREKLWSHLGFSLSAQEIDLIARIEVGPLNLADSKDSFEDLLDKVAHQARALFTEQQYSLFERELRYRLIKALIKTVHEEGVTQALGFTPFVQAFCSWKHWPYFISRLVGKLK